MVSHRHSLAENGELVQVTCSQGIGMPAMLGVSMPAALPGRGFSEASTCTGLLRRDPDVSVGLK